MPRWLNGLAHSPRGDQLRRYAAQPSSLSNSSTASGGTSLEVNASPIPCTSTKFSAPSRTFLSRRICPINVAAENRRLSERKSDAIPTAATCDTTCSTSSAVPARRMATRSPWRDPAPRLYRVAAAVTRRAWRRVNGTRVYAALRCSIDRDASMARTIRSFGPVTTRGAQPRISQFLAVWYG